VRKREKKKESFSVQMLLFPTFIFDFPVRKRIYRMRGICFRLFAAFWLVLFGI